MDKPKVADRTLPRQAVLIVNAMSRNGADAFDEVRDKLIAAGIDLIEAHAITDPSEMEPAIRDAIAKAPMVIVGGGDGSLSSNVDFFVGKDTIFAFVPLGTANSFAGTLGIPKNIDGAIDVIANGTRKWVDLGQIDADYFVNAAAIGLSPMIAQTVPHKLKRYLGVVGYLIWGLWCAIRFRPFKAIVQDEDKRTHKLWATEVRIANGTHHGGFELIESQTVDSGEIVIQVVTGRSLWGLAWSWLATVLKLRSRHGTIREFRGTQMELDTRPHLKISIDGEVAAKTPVTVRVARHIIEVAAPIEP
ncbi:YegS/Rv2252/BmrU family lipid kinase [Sphingobium subterraneum]|uniref:YegS/Rv2252/BmrU family lipid kinase n=1 Tax=Sphingobium subterraneum TaxID=627688 RepID=A0A841J224_9SPHN|nr:YegS/Rv2252/BmrU family lipid kinase [Sphingobium subterraneum]MBB6124877.1 YegS/Rv2252/BmrU family lipid kinase [Sphingobium subterraneum]